MVDENTSQPAVQPDAATSDSDSELVLLKKKTEEYLDGWKRAKADYLNFKKETEKRQTEIIQFANAALIIELLPVVDHFKLACAHIPENQKDADWVKGFIHVKNQLTDFLKNLGIEEIKTVGEKFDPSFHEAVESVTSDQAASGLVTEEVKPGYTLQGKLLQPAKVKVAK